MKNIFTVLGVKLSTPMGFQGIQLLSFTIFLSACIFANSCDIAGTEGDNSPTGIWQRYGSPMGYNTDLAVGNIPGEPANRVYMCEHPGSPSVGLYKGYISGNTITCDAVHGLPDAEFDAVGEERTLYFNVGAKEDAGKYRRGVWTGMCGELKKETTQIFYRWTDDPSCSPLSYSISSDYAGLSGGMAKNQYYGSVAPGSVTLSLYYNGSTNNYYVTLAAPADGYKRLYTETVYKFNPSVNRCNFMLGSSLTYEDQPL